MNLLKLFALIVFVGLASCKSAADTEKSVGGQSSTPVAESKKTEPVEAAGDYEKGGVSFILRKNWKVNEDEDLGGGVRYISVEDDKNATIALTLLPSGTNPDLKKYAGEFMATMQTSLSAGKITETGESETVRRAANVEKKGLARKYNISLDGETVPHTAEAFLNKARKYDSVIVYNAPDDEKSASDAGFETILYTLKTE